MNFGGVVVQELLLFCNNAVLISLQCGLMLLSCCNQHRCYQFIPHLNACKQSAEPDIFSWGKAWNQVCTHQNLFAPSGVQAQCGRLLHVCPHDIWKAVWPTSVTQPPRKIIACAPKNSVYSFPPCSVGWEVRVQEVLIRKQKWLSFTILFIFVTVF